MSKNEDDLVTLFKSIGLTQAKAAEATKSPKAATTLKTLIEKYSLTSRGLDEKQAGLISALAGQLAKSSNVDSDKEELVINKILDGSLKSTDQILGRLGCPQIFCMHRIERFGSCCKIPRFPFISYR
jgi:glutaminyl-tRNA synthetase